MKWSKEEDHKCFCGGFSCIIEKLLLCNGGFHHDTICSLFSATLSSASHSAHTSSHLYFECAL